MALNPVSTGNTVLAADINQLVNALQRSSGQTETGKYHLLFNAYATNAQGQVWIQTQSRNSTPVSVTIDTSDQSPTNCTAPATAVLTSSGFQLYTGSTGASLACNCGGNFTVQY